MISDTLSWQREGLASTIGSRMGRCSRWWMALSALGLAACGAETTASQGKPDGGVVTRGDSGADSRAEAGLPCCDSGQSYGVAGPPPTCAGCCPGLFESPIYGGPEVTAVLCMPPGAVSPNASTGKPCADSSDCGEEELCAVPAVSGRVCPPAKPTVQLTCVREETLRCPEPPTMTVCGCDGHDLTWTVVCGGLPFGWVPGYYTHTGSCVDGGSGR
jgi:hypothetical protein